METQASVVPVSGEAKPQRRFRKPFGDSTFMIRVEVPVHKLLKFREDYQKVTHKDTRDWDWNQQSRWESEGCYNEIKNKNWWDITYRVYFNADMNVLEQLRDTYGEKIEEQGPKAKYLYHLVDNKLARYLLGIGARIGENQAVIYE